MARYLLAAIVLILAGYGYAARDKSAPALALAADYLRKNNAVSARRVVDQAISEDPSNPVIYLRAMRLYGRWNRHTDEAEIGKLLIERAKQSALNTKLSEEQIAAVYFAVGVAYDRAKQIREAEIAYLEALKLEPENALILNNLGYLYADADIKPQSALKLTRKAAELSPNDGNVLDSLGWALYRNKRYTDALKTLKRAVELEPNQAEIRYHLGVVYAKTGRLVEARTELSKALVLDPSLGSARNLLHKLSIQAIPSRLLFLDVDYAAYVWVIGSNLFLRQVAANSF